MQSWPEFGSALRAARRRQNLSMRSLASSAHCSHTTIWRLENGQPAGDQDLLRDIDEILKTDSILCDSYGILVYDLWKGRGGHQLRLPDQGAKRVWQHVYPAGYSGDVWIMIQPSSASRGMIHKVELTWGPWRHLTHLEQVEDAGTVLVTGKSVDRIPVPLRAVVDPPAHLLFGTDADSAKLNEGMAIHSGWVDAEVTAEDESAAERLIILLLKTADDPAQTAVTRSIARQTARLLQSMDQAVYLKLVNSVLQRPIRR